MVSDQYAPIVGGYERQAERLSRELIRRGHAVTVLTGRWQLECPAVEQSEGLRVERVTTLRSVFRFPGLRRFSQDAYAISLARRLQQHLPRTDVVHVHSMWRGAAVSLKVADIFGTPVLVKEPNSGEGNTFRKLGDEYAGLKMRDLFLDQLRHVVVLNDDAEREYKELPFRDLTIHRGFNGIELENLPKHDPSFPPTVLSLSRLRPEKGIHLLLRAFSIALSAHPGWKLRICGDGPEVGRIRREIEELGIQAEVELAGQVADTTHELARASLLALPSLAEGMSNTLLESLAVGVPAIASTVGANSNMLRDAVGWLVPPGDVKALAQTLTAAMASESERAHRAERALQRAVEFSIGSSALRYEEIYRAMGAQ